MLDEVSCKGRLRNKIAIVTGAGSSGSGWGNGKATAVLGERIVKVHLQDVKRMEDRYAWVNLGDGDVDWAAVRQAFNEIGYAGSAVTELEKGDEAYLRDVSSRVDRLVLGRS